MKYEEYKDSGNPWLGQIPKPWKRTRLKFLFTYSNAGVWGEEEKGNENDIACFRVADFDYQKGYLSFDKLTMRNITSKELENRLLTRGSLLIEKSGGGEVTPVGRVVRFNYNDKATCSNFVHFVTVNDLHNSDFLYYYFHAMYANKENLLYFNQTTGIQNLKIGEYLGQSIFLPSLQEQQAIATYLDEKCEKINTAIEVQKKKIELLEELKYSIITDAVTKGLNPKAPMKDSGVEWIGEVPSHWEIMPLKSCGQFKKGVTFTKADIVEEGIPVISYGQIHAKNNTGTHLHEDLIRYIPNSFVKGSTISKVSKGDFIFADTSEDYEGCGNCVYIDMDYSLYGGYHTIVYKTKTQENKFLAYLFKTDCWRYQIRSRVSGVKVFSITQSIISLCSVVLPPLSEQQAIAAHLDKECEKIATQISKANRRIELLEELKQSIITEAVTGKIKVC